MRVRFLDVLYNQRLNFAPDRCFLRDGELLGLVHIARRSRSDDLFLKFLLLLAKQPDPFEAFLSLSIATRVFKGQTQRLVKIRSRLGEILKTLLTIRIQLDGAQGSSHLETLHIHLGVIAQRDLILVNKYFKLLCCPDTAENSPDQGSSK